MSYQQPYPPQPAMTYEEYQRRQDADHLNLLSIFFYVVGAITALFSCVFLVHFAIGLMALTHPAAFSSPHDSGPPAFFGWMFTLMGGGAVLLGWTLGGLTIFAGRCLARRSAYGFLLVMACLNCLQMPLGTALGVFTLVVLTRPSVKALFGVGDAVPPATPSGEPWYRGGAGTV